MLRLESDLKISFEQIGIKFQSIVNEERDRLEAIAKEAVENFDFENVLRMHITEKINEGLEAAFSEIDLKENLKIKIWGEINKKLDQI